MRCDKIFSEIVSGAKEREAESFSIENLIFFLLKSNLCDIPLFRKWGMTEIGFL
jgi:hypothetical protein